jgi:hypothetical protein
MSVSRVSNNTDLTKLSQDPITQYPAYISYATANPYHPLVSASEIRRANILYTKSGGCRDQVGPSRIYYLINLSYYRPQIISCNKGGPNSVCSAAQNYCNHNILSPLAGNYDVSPPLYYFPKSLFKSARCRVRYIMCRQQTRIPILQILLTISAVSSRR